MQRRRPPVYLLAVVVCSAVIVAGCSDSSLLFPRIEQPSEARVDSVEQGSVLTMGDVINVEVTYSDLIGTDQDGDDTVLVEIRDSLGALVAEFVFNEEAIIGAEQSAGGPAMQISLSDLPGLSAGRYLVTTILYDGDMQVATGESSFFYNPTPLLVSAVSSFPASYWPGSSGLLVAAVSSAPGSDPYLRWTLSGELIAEGYLSEGLDQVLIRAPEAEGVYPVILSLYPVDPSGSAGSIASDSDARYATTLRQSGEVVVTRSRRLGETDLVPEDSYYSLFHFLGDLRDDGARFSVVGDSELSRSARLVGDPDLQIRGDIFGYALDGDDGFAVDSYLIPTPAGLASLADVAASAETVSPFSLNLRMLVSDLTTGGNILSTTSADGSFDFDVSVDSFGVLEASLATPNGEFFSNSGLVAVQEGVPVSVSLSVIPDGDVLHMMWFVDGLFLSASALPRSNPGGQADQTDQATDPTTAGGMSNEASGGDLSGGGVSDGMPNGMFEGETSADSWAGRAGIAYVGSDGVDPGFRGIIDELGVYFRDAGSRPASDQEIFLRAMEDEHGLSLVYAQGFERLDLPEELVSTGQVAIQSSRLTLYPGATVTLPAFLFDGDQLIVEVDLDDDAFSLPGRFVFSEVDDRNDAVEEPLFVATSDGRLFAGNDADSSGDPVATLEDAADMYLRMTRTATGLDVAMIGGMIGAAGAGDVEPVSMGTTLDPFSGLQLRIEHPTALEVPLHVISILARRDSDELGRRLNPLADNNNDSRRGGENNPAADSDGTGAN